MDANVELNRRKGQPSGKSTDYWQTNGRIPETYGGKLTGNQCHSPTRRNNRKADSGTTVSMGALRPETSATAGSGVMRLLRLKLH